MLHDIYKLPKIKHHYSLEIFMNREYADAYEGSLLHIQHFRHACLMQV